jgi:hypothetical protein
MNARPLRRAAAFAVASATLDRVHHRLLVTVPDHAPPAVGTQIAKAVIVTPTERFILENCMISGFTATGFSLNYTAVNVQ